MTGDCTSLHKNSAIQHPSMDTDDSDFSAADSNDQLGYTRPGPTFQFVKQAEGNESGTAVKLEVSS